MQIVGYEFSLWSDGRLVVLLDGRHDEYDRTGDAVGPQTIRSCRDWNCLWRRYRKRFGKIYRKRLEI